MTVYVDNAMIEATVASGRIRHDSKWCHLMADTRQELIRFAVRELGLKVAYLQNKRSGVHFDVTLRKRELAVTKGAVEIEIRSEEWFRVVSMARSQYKPTFGSR